MPEELSNVVYQLILFYQLSIYSLLYLDQELLNCFSLYRHPARYQSSQQAEKKKRILPPLLCYNNTFLLFSGKEVMISFIFKI